MHDYMPMGYLGAGMEVPTGTRMYTSPALQAIVATQKGSDFYAAAKEAVLSGWNIRAVGSQTPAEVVDRIAGMFTEFGAARWVGPISAYALASSPDLEQTVNLVCPLCSKKTVPTPLPTSSRTTTGVTSTGMFTTGGGAIPWYTQYRTELLIGAGVVGAALLLGLMSRKRRSAPAASTVLLLPSTVMPALPAPAK